MPLILLIISPDTLMVENLKIPWLKKEKSYFKKNSFHCIKNGIFGMFFVRHGQEILRSN